MVLRMGRSTATNSAEVSDSSSHSEVKVPTRVTRGPHEASQTLFPTTSNTCYLTWVFAYQPPLAFDPLKDLGKLQ